MRFLVASVLLVLVLAFVTMQWLGVFGDTDVPPPPNAGGARPSVSTPRTSGPTADAPATGLVATRTRAHAPPAPTGLADAPTAWLRVVDHATARPVGGAAVRRVQDGAELTFTDERGLAGVPLREQEQLAVIADGYLVRLVPTRLGSTEDEPQEVRAVRDEWSFVRRFHFAAPAGNPVAEAFVRFRPATAAAAPPPRGAPGSGPTGDAVLQRAWVEHTMLAGRPVCADLPVQLGVWAEDRVHRLPERAEVRFAAAGDFTVEVATGDGLVARAELRIDGKLRVDANVLRIMLAPGAVVSGTVVDRTSAAAVAGAEVTLQGGEPLGLVATSTSDGAFRIGPLLPGVVTLHARHADHEPLAVGPVTAPANDVRIALQPLPRTSLRGRVRARPALQPLPRAFVSWTPPGGALVAVTTGADGTFVLPATGDQDARLAVHATGYVPYAELVAPGAPFADYDLWPATTTERLGAGLTALLEGVVLDAENNPVAGAAVRLQPAQRTLMTGTPGRRVLEGGALELPLATTAATDGSFRLETNQFGPGRLFVSAERAIPVVAVAGQTVSNLRLQP